MGTWKDLAISVNPHSAACPDSDLHPRDFRLDRCNGWDREFAREREQPNQAVRPATPLVIIDVVNNCVVLLFAAGFGRTGCGQLPKQITHQLFDS